MPMASAKFVPYEMKSSLVRIFSYQDKNPVGTLENAFYEEEQCFDSLIQLIFMIEKLQDMLCFPQKAMESRKFISKEITAPLEEKSTKERKYTNEPLATLKINVIFRQNASWQGSVVWVEKSLESEFRSVLELISLMDSVLAEE